MKKANKAYKTSPPAAATTHYASGMPPSIMTANLKKESMPNSNEYFFNLSKTPLANASLNESTFQIRTVQTADASLLAELMIDAYRGTIDYDGETFNDALAEVNAFL